MKVLYADDDESSRLILEAALTARGHDVVLASDGIEALEKARDWLPDLIISDILMPTLDGYGLRRALHQDPALRNIPFVFYTGTFLDGEDARLAMDLGASRFLLKPMPPDELLEALSEVMAEGPPPVPRAPGMDEDELARRTSERLSDKLYKKYLEAADKQRRLEAREATLQGLVAAIPDVLFSLDPETLAPTYVSPVVEAILHYSPEDLVNDPDLWRSMVHPEDLEPILETFRRAIADGGPAWMEGRLRPRDEPDYRWFDVRIAISLDREVRPVAITGVLREVTELKAADSRKRQVERIQALGQLTGGVAHDFNNLLSVMLGNLQLAERYLARDESPLQNQVVSRLRLAIDAVRRGTELTRRLLAFASRQPLDPEVTDLNELVNGIWELLKRTLRESIGLRFVAGQDLWPVSIDPGQAENALINLAVNASDAMADEGSLVIETANVHLDDSYTRSHEDMEPGEYVAVTVSDSGTGMTEEEQARAFEPFFTTKDTGKGTGLGLSQVYGFVRQSGGGVSIYSEMGLGTTLKLYFPRFSGETGSRPPAPAEAAVTGGGERILVVEDDQSLRDTVACYLRDLGYEVLEAADGASALRVLARSAVDMLFTDVIMPGGMTGLDLGREARALKPGLRILYTSGYSFDALSRSAGLQPDGHQIMNKPYNMGDLARRVRETLDG